MIKNLIFDVGNVIVTENGARVFPYLTQEEKSYLNHLVYSKESGFDKPILGYQTTEQYRNELIEKEPKYRKELEILLSHEGMPIALPKKTDVINLIYSLKPKYQIYFLSNMIDITYDYLLELLNNFDGGAYSFQEHTKKPNSDFYQILMNRYNLEPSECIFFDDRESNVLAAKEIGIHATLFKDINDINKSLTKFS